MELFKFTPVKNEILREDYSKIFQENLINREELIRKISCTISGSKRSCKYFFEIEGEEKFFYLHYFSFYFNREGNNKDYAEKLFSEMEKNKYCDFHKLNFLKRIGELRVKNKKYYAKLFYILIAHNFYRSAFGALVNFYAINDRKLCINIDEETYRQFLLYASESNDNILIDEINLEVRNITFLSNEYDINFKFKLGEANCLYMKEIIEKYSEERKITEQKILPLLKENQSIDTPSTKNIISSVKVDLFTDRYNIFRVKKLKMNELIVKDGNYAKRKKKIDEINTCNKEIYAKKLKEKKEFEFIFTELKNKIERITENKTKSKLKFNFNIEQEDEKKDFSSKSWGEIKKR